MKAKVFMANLREVKKLLRVPDASLTPIVGSRGIVPTFHLTRSEAIRLELSRRSYMTAEARALRAGMISLR